MVRPIRVNTPFVDNFKTITLRHVADTPMTFDSRRGRDEYLKAHNLTMDK